MVKGGFENKMGSFLKIFSGKKRVRIGMEHMRSSFCHFFCSNPMNRKREDWRWPYKHICVNFSFLFFFLQPLGFGNYRGQN